MEMSASAIYTDVSDSTSYLGIAGKCRYVLEIYSATGADLILNHSDASATQGLGQITFSEEITMLASVNGVTGSTDTTAEVDSP